MDVRQPSLESLAFILRNKLLWPRGFIWDYASYEWGPIGLARSQWGGPGVNLEAKEYVQHWAVVLKTDYETIRWLFFHDICYWYRPLGFALFPRAFRAITPALIAREIDRHLGHKLRRDATSPICAAHIDRPATS